jgi:hypothetical protein
MFLFDSLLVSGLRWVLDTVATATDAEMNDDAALRDRLLDAEMRRETGEISDEDFAAIEADLLTRIRHIKERREGGSGPVAFGQPMDLSTDSELRIEATVSGDFHSPEQVHIESAQLRPSEPSAHFRAVGLARTSAVSRSVESEESESPRTPRSRRTPRTRRTSRTS